MSAAETEETAAVTFEAEPGGEDSHEETYAEEDEDGAPIAAAAAPEPPVKAGFIFGHLAQDPLFDNVSRRH